MHVSNMETTMNKSGLKPLKPIVKKPTTRDRCEHYWSYEHTIYSLSENGDGIGAHRQCSKCGIHELCKVQQPKWTRNVKGFALTDMRRGTAT